MSGEKEIPLDEIENEIELNNTPQPEINTLKAGRKNQRIAKILFFFIAVGVIGFAAFKIYSTFFNKTVVEDTANTAKPTENFTPHKRKDLSADVDPFEQAKPASNGNAGASADTGDQGAEKPPTNVFKRYLAVASQQGNSQGQSKNMSRVKEMQLVDTDINGNDKTEDDAKKQGTPTVSRITLNPDLYIPENTYIPCTLGVRFVSDVGGRIKCVISEDVYSANGNTKLIEKGTEASGVYKGGTLKQGQSYMFIQWTKLTTKERPYKKINLVDTQVVGQLGEAGIDGWIDTHFWERFGNAMMLSSVQDVAAAAANNAQSKDSNTDYTANSRESMAEMAKTALENSINIPPTIYKNQGDIIGILVGEDISFENVYALKLKRT